MAKPKLQYRCAECGATAPKWAGQCTECKAWNTLSEETVAPKSASLGGGGSIIRAAALQTVSASEATRTPLVRTTTGIGELDRVLGGGLVPGSFALLGGEPGIGKSTLTLQLAASYARAHGTVLIASGEESTQQIALRAERADCAVESLQLAACTTLEEILATAEALQPRLLIVDSVQVMTSLALPGVPGGIQQVRAVAEGLLRYAKTTGTPVVLIGHVTKEGDLAGPRVLSHLVDTVLHLSGDSHRDLRLLTTTKNRFGATAEVGVFAMESKGLVEVPNPSELFLAERAAAAPGSCIAVTLEGTRPLLVEVQALVTPARFAYPQRVTSGFPASRLALIIAVLTRCAGVQLDSSDVFVNVVGGLRLGEPAADLPVALALASSLKKKALPATLAAFGEVGLTGEVRSVTGRELRAKEAKKLGFTVTPERTSLVDLLKKIC